jgi:hypothetical protein
MRGNRGFAREEGDDYNVQGEMDRFAIKKVIDILTIPHRSEI